MAGRGTLASLGVTPTPRMGGQYGEPGSDDLSRGRPSYVGQYDTYLAPQEEAQFQAWLQDLSAAKGYNAAEDLVDYDLRGAWKQGAQQATNGHLPDTFKKPNHPTFSTGSQYSNQQTAGGEWVDLGNGKWAFQASPFNMQMIGPERLSGYFQRVEPDSALQMPSGVTPTPVGALSSLGRR